MKLPPEGIYSICNEASVRGFQVKKQDEEGLSEIMDSTLIIALGLVLAVVVAVLVFGVFTPVDKTAYLVPQFGIGNVSGHTFITIFNRGGEPVYFYGSPQAKYKAELYVDTQSGSYKAVPAPTLGVFKPGDRIYVFYTGSDFVVTNTLSGFTFPSLPSGKITVKLVDATSGVLIAKEDLIPAATNPVSMVTTITPTPHTITVSWQPWGLGTVTPPGGNPGAPTSVKVAHGTDQTFVATPDSKKAVLSVTADGVTVYSGSLIGTPVPYTFSNVVADHTLSVRFG
jgi:hypothetical protein